jgi:hypothetical protein
MLVLVLVLVLVPDTEKRFYLAGGDGALIERKGNEPSSDRLIDGRTDDRAEYIFLLGEGEKRALRQLARGGAG